MIYLIRHGQTEANLNGVYYGRSESPLTKKGEEDHRRAAKKLKDEHIDMVITSPRQRCRVLGDELCTMFNIELTVDERLAEIDFGIFEGLKHTEAQQRYPQIWDRWVNAGDEYRLENGESISMFESRIDEFAEYILEISYKNDIAIVTHSGVISSLVCKMLNLDKEIKWRFRIGNGAVLKIDNYDGYAYIVFD
jgi:alpha-ribazole phosphatase